MKKKTKIKEIIEEVETPVPAFISETIEKCQESKAVSPLAMSFPNEDMNKVVEKINEIIKQL